MPDVRKYTKKARRTWGQIWWVLEKKEVPPHVDGVFYQAVVTSVLLCGSECWVLLPSAYKALKGFHVEVACRLTDMQPLKVKEGGFIQTRGTSWRQHISSQSIITFKLTAPPHHYPYHRGP